MNIVRKWALAIVAALTIGAAGLTGANAAPLGGLNQAAASVNVAAKAADPVAAPQIVRYYRGYGRRFYGRRFYRPRYYGYRRYYRPYYRPYYRHYYRPHFYRPYRFF
jgi:hypothetical protein